MEARRNKLHKKRNIHGHYRNHQCSSRFQQPSHKKRNYRNGPGKKLSQWNARMQTGSEREIHSRNSELEKVFICRIIYPSGKNQSEFGDIKFHQCVRLSTFENNREIKFIPPNGDFQLVSYRLEQKLRPMFLLDIRIVEYTSTKLEMMIKVKSNFKKKCKA